MTLDDTATTYASRDLNSGFYKSQGTTTDAFAGTSPSSQISDTMNGTGTAAESEEPADTTPTRERGLASSEVDLRPYSERRGGFCAGYDNYGSDFENFGGGSSAEKDTSSASASMLESSWEANDGETDSATASADSPSETPSTWEDQNYAPGKNEYDTRSGKYS